MMNRLLKYRDIILFCKPVKGIVNDVLLGTLLLKLGLFCGCVHFIVIVSFKRSYFYVWWFCFQLNTC